MAFLRKGFLKSAHRHNELYCRIDPSPVAAIFVFFLALFMVIQPPVCHMSYVQRVVARHARYMPNAIREDAITITLWRDGTFFFGGTHVICDDVPHMIHDAVRNGAEKRIYLEIDARAKYGDVSVLLAQIQKSGIENVSILANSPGLVVSPASISTQ